jgi:hypothetical protein
MGSNSDSVWARGEVLLKTAIKFIFPVFFEELLLGKNCLKAKGKGAKEEVCFVHKILVFHFFSLFPFAHGHAWYYFQCNRYDPNVKFFIFSEFFTRSTVLKFWVKTLVDKKSFNSLIITNMELRFEPCVLNLKQKWCAKDLEKREDHLIFINCGVKKFTMKNTQKKRKLWCLNVIKSPRSHGIRIYNFLKLISNKVTSRSYSYFLKFSYFYFLRNWFFQLFKSCKVW